MRAVFGWGDVDDGRVDEGEARAENGSEQHPATGRRAVADRPTGGEIHPATLSLSWPFRNQPPDWSGCASRHRTAYVTGPAVSADAGCGRAKTALRTGGMA